MASVDDVTEDLKNLKFPKAWEEIFSAKNLSRVARKLGAQWKDLAYQLDFEMYECDNFDHGGVKPPREAATNMLIAYRDKSKYYKTARQVDDFLDALREMELYHIVNDLQTERPKPIPPAPVVRQPQQCTEPSGTEPQIFLSYNWGKQPQVIKLYQYLTSQGYTCWLDINQMTAGDELNNAMEKGIRDCNVLVACMTSKYCGSLNCQREATLADGLKKVIIPLKMEKELKWPPENLGIIFAQKIYIDFCKPDESVQNDWANNTKTKELCDKLNKALTSK